MSSVDVVVVVDVVSSLFIPGPLPPLQLVPPCSYKRVRLPCKRHVTLTNLSLPTCRVVSDATTLSSSLFLLVFMSHYQLSQLLSILLLKKETFKLLTVKTGEIPKRKNTERHEDVGGESRLDVHSMAPLSEGHSVFFSASYTRASSNCLSFSSRYHSLHKQHTLSFQPNKHPKYAPQNTKSLSLSSSSQMSTEQNMLDNKWQRTLVIVDVYRRDTDN